ncbi:beta-glucosidase 22-like [Tasmannia lanceolata]|uniref:beta-glucosidase 22-like n=1 Tax=Tasmannia lanceolata TaxID=3420 RepID=UPI004062878F
MRVHFLCLLLIIVEVVWGQNTPKFSRNDFPSDFIFGAGTSAYQVEGAVAQDGRKPSIWDTFTHAGEMPDNSTGDIASDQYHKYKEDVKFMTDIGLDAYRFSISWSRLIPNGRGDINPKGLEYYNNLIDELISHGIQPHVTIHHLDLPQALEDEYAGWLSPKIVKDFTAYAKVCFREFGDRVTHWTTINQPNILAMTYSNDLFPPMRCSSSSGLNCKPGNSSVEPYLVGHHALLAHAAAATLYKEKYQGKQNGLIGLNVYSFWCVPFTNSTADVTATKRVLDFITGWLVNPLIFGDYPEIVKKNAGSRIPTFTKHQSEKVKGSFDFLGLNHYTTVYVQDSSKSPQKGLRDFNGDMFAKLSATKDGTPGQYTPSYLSSTPSGLQKILEYFKKVYGNPPIYIQENGRATPYNETLNDTARIDYLSGYLNATLSAVRDGSNARGYFVWSFLDVFELLSGYQLRFGLYYVDFESKELTRQPKLSAKWYSNFLKKSKEMNIEKANLHALTHSPL